MSDQRISGYCQHNWTDLSTPCPECAATATAPAPATGGGYYPRALRLVLQLEDTPENRRTIELAKAEVEKCVRVVRGRGILKLEEINIVSVLTGKPIKV